MKTSTITAIMSTVILCGCANNSKKNMATEDFKWQIDRFDDVKVLRFQVPSFEELTLNQKLLTYYLSEAALWGRDIFTDQNFKYNLSIRSVLENIYTSEKIDKTSADFKALEVYLKKVWFANGIHHHYSGDKFTPKFSEQYFRSVAEAVGTSKEDIDTLSDVLFSRSKYMQRCNQTEGVDMVATSSGNYYDGVSQAEVEKFYADMAADAPDKEHPVSYGLNSRLVKEGGVIKELTYKINGLYGKEIAKIVENLEKAIEYAENENQKTAISTLISYYKSGDLKEFDHYNVLWVQDTLSSVDFTNGFIENYNDPMGYKASWEANVNFKNVDATRRTDVISKNAQWFEDNSPIDDCYKKKSVRGVSAKVITVATIGGDCFPATPIGINLPNSDWIRKEHGSKSVTIQNITDAYTAAALGDGFTDEFTLRDEDIEIAKKYGSLAGNLHTDLHECLGHGSGQLAPGTKGDELKNYGSPLEEARADLFGLYYLGDEKLVELSIAPDMNVMKAAYNNFIFNGMMGQLTRIEEGKDIVQAHMRDRQLISTWCYEKGRDNNVIEIVKKDEKSYIVINDYKALRTLFAQLLKEIQRIKSEGDFAACKALVEGYGVKVNKELHAEVLNR
ncbi:MAG: dihydrofolate reductase, partial [Rikenellaceae bacterium]